ncbi:MAG: hypothetical protein WBC19_04215 [Pyrinomonadaceae bacterium]
MVFLLISAARAQAVDTSCPKISVIDSGMAMPGENFRFTANIEGEHGKVGYKWSLTNARIMSGQGTKEVTAVYDIGNVYITGTVTIDGLPSNCVNSASGKFNVNIEPTYTRLAEYANLRWKQEVKHFPVVRLSMDRDPNAQIYLFIYHRSKGLASATARVEKIKKYFKPDENRLTFQFESSDRDRTDIYLVPAGVDRPSPRP